jgi:16S rRNA (cytosine1402-N4)-methyltransferase
VEAHGGEPREAVNQLKQPHSQASTKGVQDAPQVVDFYSSACTRRFVPSFNRDPTGSASIGHLHALPAGSATKSCYDCYVYWRILWVAVKRTMMTTHVPVLADEVVQWLAPKTGQVIVDGTLGGGGHTRLLAEKLGPDGFVLALDRDPQALARAETSLAGRAVKLVHANFRELPQVLEELQLPTVDGVLLDLGLSSDQLADATRGFSFDADGWLDLRFDAEVGEPAWRLLERLDAEEIANLIYEYGEERFSRRIARQIVEARHVRPIRQVAELADLIRRCVPRAKHHRIDPATRTFQALRIAVNDELGSLEAALRTIPGLLRVGGRIAVISFHSLEDRRVKHAFRDDPQLMILTKKPIRPNEAELVRNPRSRSARMRVAERVAIV